MATGNQDGYGFFAPHHKNVSAHRYSFELYKGPIPKGMKVLHQCDVPACVNPDHLFLGTDLDNARDKTRKGRGNFVQGERQGSSKLTEAAVIDIKTKRLSQSEFAKLYGVQIGTIWKVLNGYSWTHVR
jgi:HNH endonuclease